MTVARSALTSLVGGAAVAFIAGAAAAAAPSPALDEAFRIDLSRVDVVYDIDPNAPTLEGRAVLTFTMRPGQDRALFHFEPELQQGTTRQTLRAITLDGESLDPMDDADLAVIRFDGSRQRAFELQRDLAAGVEHTLTVEWSIWNFYASDEPGWFRTLVDDTIGLGNEMLWPTINSPEELARHTIEVRIRDARDYLMIGSGVISSRMEDDLQIWSLDTVREISSYTVMLAAMPLEEVVVETFDAGSIPVTIASTEGPTKTAVAVDVTKQVLGELEDDFGPFPMPSMQILLIDWQDGMEYYGATTTGLGSLSHELVHMWWGCSAVNRTWRDTWLDEAITVWWDESARRLPRGFRSDIAASQSPIETGFDPRAYGRGARVIAQVAEALGGSEAMTALLADVHRRRAFQPFSTDDFSGDVVEWTGNEGLRQDLERWLSTTDAAGPELGGVWRRQGNGELIQIRGKKWKRFEVTAENCQPAGRDWTAGVRRRITGVSRNGDRLALGLQMDATRLHFELVPTGLPEACRGGGSRAARDPVHNFEVFWHTFAENYPFFEERGVDWAAQYAAHRPSVDANTSRKELVALLSTMALPLNDGQATLQDRPIHVPPAAEQRLRDEWRASGGRGSFDAFVAAERKAFEQRFDGSYLGGEVAADGRKRIVWGRLDPETGYLRIDSMEGYARRRPGRSVDNAREVLRKVLRDFAEVESVVIDLRWNEGGIDETGLAMAGFFTDVPRDAFSERAVDGAGTAPEQTMRVWPQTREPFLGRIFLLTSSLTAGAAETFALALRARGDVSLIGEPSAGSLSGSLERTLPNGWTFSLSNEIHLDPEGVLYEGAGIPVDVEATFFEPADRAAGIDRAIDSVLAELGNL